MKKIHVLLKIIAFTVIFFLLTIPLAFLLKDDANSYARSLFYEFYRQEKIDYLICGASHVSHGVEANIASQKFGKSVFNTGTPSQKIDGTYAILKQAVKLYKIEKVFLELDFAITCAPAFFERTGLTSEYIVASRIKDFSIKIDYLLNCSSPKHYFNSFLPIGKDKLITLNPSLLAEKIISLIAGEYFKGTYHSDDAEYSGKGCLLDLDEVINGGFSNYSKEGIIQVSKITDDWKNTVDKIIELCRENDIELILYSMPCSDFYLNERGNYDEYYSFCRNFTSERGFTYYDFNLARPDLFSALDSDYYDDNHFNKKGVYKWTDCFCDFFSAKYIEENNLEKYFYSSYAEKMAAQLDRIFGLYMITSDDKKSMEIIPLANHVASNRITYDVYAVCGSEKMLLAKNSSQTTVELPAGKSGKIRVISYMDGIKQNDCSENFASF
ncbi:hypothetical protein [Treponema ruminis]|uniref:Uncharacterized protein n=1 Tax=Treponema ruminis TaxID=744515 RepID=A0A7W8G7Q5_9SPIR|nr:hypothetical protein [Treponema ruminis]MBB5225269.1 hypothetical protein [Treponema ruminis]